MMFEIELHAFNGGGQIRQVDVPDNEARKAVEDDTILDRVFVYGQNDFQPQPLRSVSMGDIIRLDGRRHIIRAVGFEEVSANYLPTEDDWIFGEATNVL